MLTAVAVLVLVGGMTALAGISALLLTGVGWIVGGRLLLLARRTRQAPELMLGLDFLLIGGIGYPLAIASAPLAASGWLLPAVVALVGSTTSSHVGMLFHGLFTRAVFRPQERWARWIVIASGANEEIKLDHPIPVHLTYFTAWPDESGKIVFYADTYKRDKRLDKALNSLAVALN